MDAGSTLHANTITSSEESIETTLQLLSNNRRVWDSRVTSKADHPRLMRCFGPALTAITAHAVSDEPCRLTSLPAELLTLVAEALDAQSLAAFAAASAACLAAAHSELRARLLGVVVRCLVPGASLLTPGVFPSRISNAQVACPYFRFPDDLVAIKGGAFSDNTSLTKLDCLPAALTTIGNCAFRGCFSLRELTLPESLITIGYGAFEECISLRELTIPAAVTSIGDTAFRRCSSLTKLTLPAAMSTIDNYAFDGCESLVEISLPTALVVIGVVSFDAAAR